MNLIKPNNVVAVGKAGLPIGLEDRSVSDYSHLKKSILSMSNATTKLLSFKR